MKNSSTKTLKIVLTNPSVVKTSSQAKQIHAHIMKLQGFRREFTTIILSIYSNFNLLQDSLSLFNTFYSPPPTKAWKSIIKCCASNGHLLDSIYFFKKMKASGKSPDRNVFPSLFKTCAHLRDLRFGQTVHGCVVRLGLDTDLFTGNALMNMYAKLEVFNVFDGRSEPNRILVLNKSLNKTENPHRFFRDSIENVQCFDEKCKGEALLNDIVKDRFNCNGGEINVVGGLKNGRKMGSFPADSVRKIFETMPIKDVVSWNTVIGGYIQNGMYDEALSTVREMGNANLKLDSFTLSSILPIAAQYVNVMTGKEIHGYAIRHNFDTDVFIGSSLIDMYANCSRLDDSYNVFTLSPQKDSVSWNSIIAGCMQNGSYDNGLKLFREMLLADIDPVAVSFSSIMPACAHLTTLSLGKQLHGYIMRRGFDYNIYVSSALMDMYAKCGKLSVAKWIFDKMEFQDTISWTTMIMAYAVHSHACDAILLFKRMEKEGIKPNFGSFVAVLTACSHAGLVDESLNYFTSMTRDYAISPGLEHYSAVSDLLSRAGRLDEAYKFISSMHIEATGEIWSTLLSACRVHKNVELAEKVAKKMFISEPHNVSAYVLLSNVYIAVGRYKDAAKLRIATRKKGIVKKAACSWIEVKNKVHVFVSGEENHPNYPEVNEVIRDLMKWMELEEYIRNANLAIHDVDE